MSKKWIQKVTKHKGNLTKWAKEHRFINNNDTINLSKAHTAEIMTCVIPIGLYVNAVCAVISIHYLYF